jgi:hypothetical protein
MKQDAVKELAAAGLPTTAQVIIEYMGERHVLTANPTVKLETGKIMFNFNAFGPRRLQIAENLTFSVGGNLITNQEIDNHAAILARYGLTVTKGSLDVDEATLDAGESTD